MTPMLDWQTVKHVFLDLDGTLLDLHFDNHFWRELLPQRHAERYGLPIDEAKRHLYQRYQHMEGRLEWYCLDYWSRQLDLDLRGLKLEVADLITVLPHVSAFLHALGTDGKRILLVTNAHPESLRLKLEKTGLRGFFDAVICSHMLGLPKEHPDFWTRLHAVEPFEPETTLLVDDSLPVLRAAREYGIKHVVVVTRPDSRQPPRPTREFPAIEDFRALMPQPNANISG